MTQTRHDADTSAEDVDDTVADEIGAPEDELVEEVVEPDRPRLELSATQLAAGALAAMTAAIIGARLSLAGTVVGAAVGSLIAGIAGSLYSVSLRRTQHRLMTLAKTPAGSKALGAVATTTATVRAVTRPAETRGDTPRARAAEAATAVQPRATAQPAARPTAPETGTGAREATRRRRLWKPVLATAAATFVLTAIGVTAIELVSGQALSGGDGTTISQVRTDSGSDAVEQEPMQVPTDDESTAEEAPSDTPTESPTEDATEQPTEQPTSEPSEQPSETPSEQPTEVPTEQATPTPTPEPTEQPTPADESGTETPVP